MDRLKVKIDGMTCGHCVGAVKQALTKLDGVTITSLGVGQAEVAYDPAKVNPPTILAAVEDAGYPAHATSSAS
jgi:copper chaperone